MKFVQETFVDQLRVVSCAIHGVSHNVAQDILNNLCHNQPIKFVAFDSLINQTLPKNADTQAPIKDRRPEFLTALARAEQLIDEAVTMLEPFCEGVNE